MSLSVCNNAYRRTALSRLKSVLFFVLSLIALTSQIASAQSVWINGPTGAEEGHGVHLNAGHQGLYPNPDYSYKWVIPSTSPLTPTMVLSPWPYDSENFSFVPPSQGFYEVSLTVHNVSGINPQYVGTSSFGVTVFTQGDFTTIKPTCWQLPRSWSSTDGGFGSEMMYQCDNEGVHLLFGSPYANIALGSEVTVTVGAISRPGTSTNDLSVDWMWDYRLTPYNPGALQQTFTPPDPGGYSLFVTNG